MVGAASGADRLQRSAAQARTRGGWARTAPLPHTLNAAGSPHGLRLHQPQHTNVSAEDRAVGPPPSSQPSPEPPRRPQAGDRRSSAPGPGLDVAREAAALRGPGAEPRLSRRRTRVGRAGWSGHRPRGFSECPRAGARPAAPGDGNRVRPRLRSARPEAAPAGLPVSTGPGPFSRASLPAAHPSRAPPAVRDPAPGRGRAWRSFQAGRAPAVRAAQKGLRRLTRVFPAPSSAPPAARFRPRPRTGPTGTRGRGGPARGGSTLGACGTDVAGGARGGPGRQQADKRPAGPPTPPQPRLARAGPARPQPTPLPGPGPLGAPPSRRPEVTWRPGTAEVTRGHFREVLPLKRRGRESSSNSGDKQGAVPVPTGV